VSGQPTAPWLSLTLPSAALAPASAAKVGLIFSERCLVLTYTAIIALWSRGTRVSTLIRTLIYTYINAGCAQIFRVSHLCDGVPMMPRAARHRAISKDQHTDIYMMECVIALSVVTCTSVGCRDWRGAAGAFGCNHSVACDDNSWPLA
jgi:hypothetical protein